ncbi:MAG TPA: cell division protein FtsQ/DivIB [Xanthobacteraceae bacterium]|nr:cell division protein FtsQ/DivIB [Xanthobacteraceae bacterium]
MPRHVSSNRLVALVERYAPRRAMLKLAVVVILGSVTFGVVKGGHVNDVTAALSDARNAVANAVGFRITSVAINGRHQLTQDEVLAIGGVNGRSSLLFLDAATVRGKLTASPWIADATVLKLYPGHLQIDLTERKAFALWQKDGQLAVIAEDGAVLEPYVTRRFTSLPLVVGAGAETRARDFLAQLAQYPSLSDKVKAIIYVGERRWNLRLDTGLDVRLPEHDVSRALATLVRLDKEQQLLSRDLTAVDLRLAGRVVVRLSEDAAKARSDLLNKDKKIKRKAGDA